MAGGKGKRGRQNRYRPRQRKRVSGGRARADRQLAQGTGRTVARPFLSAPRSITLRAWDAFDQCHAALPRATGPYAVVRTTALMKSAAKYVQFGTFQRLDIPAWSNLVCTESVNSALPINGNQNVKFKGVPMPGGSGFAIASGSGLTCVPSAISVQIMNPQALQTTKGIIAAAVSNTQLDLNDRLQPWDDVATGCISYLRPRLMSAGKLALRGVQLNSYPLNMAAVADFLPMSYSPDQGGTLNSAAVASTGWAPIVVINESAGDTDPVELQFLVSVEWRVRFDISNPAVASHAHHGVTDDWNWNRMLQNAVNMGNGVLDIVERVASAGQAVQAIAGPAMRRAPLMLTAA